MRKIIFYPLISLAAFSCGDRSDTFNMISGREPYPKENDFSSFEMGKDEYIKWCAEDETVINNHKEISKMVYMLSYLPPEAMACIDLKRKQYTLPDLKKVAKEYEHMLYFKFKIEAKDWSSELLKYDLKNAAQYDDRLKYISFDMQKDIYLIQGIDTIISDLYQYERAFNVTPYVTVMIAFDKHKINTADEIRFVFNDRLFEKGFVKFTYKKNQLNNIPKISGV